MPYSTNPAIVKMSGQLAPHRQRFWLYLLKKEYSPLSAMNLVRLLAHFDRWLTENNIELGSINYSTCETYFSERRRAGYVCWISVRSINLIGDYLIHSLVLEPLALKPPQDKRFLEVLLNYRHWLEIERNLSACVVDSREITARNFLLEVSNGNGSMPLKNLMASDLLDYIYTRLPTYSAGSIRWLQCNLRSFFHFLFLDNLIECDLRGALLAASSCKQAALPQILEKAQIQALLSTCDRRKHRGRRDYAMMLLMFRLGLRVSDVASITLDDIDWQAGQLRVSGKNKREEQLPLPEEVGMALVEYLKRGRPKTTERALFFTLIAPVRMISAGTVSAAIRHACLLAGLPPGSVPRLRHTAASQLLSAGASLDEIAQVLRHRSIDTTAIYAKVDQRALSELVRPWPELSL